MPEFTLPSVTPAHAVRHVAGRHGLPPGASPVSLAGALAAVVALHATEPATPYLSLWARLPGFTPAHLDAALYDQRTVVRTAAMRTTIHLIHTAELPFFYQATVSQRRRLDQAALRYSLDRVAPGVDAAAYLDDLRGQILRRLESSGPATAADLAQAIPPLKAPVPYGRGAYTGAFALGSRLVPALCTAGLLVRARIRGTWRSSQCEYDLLPRWLPGIDLGSVDREQATAWLVRRYIQQFGPVTVRDAAWWTGLPARDIARALADLGDAVVSVALGDHPEPHLLLASDLREVLALPDSPPDAAWLLPSLDPLIMGYTGRARFLSPDDAGKAFDRSGNALPTAWFRGRVVGLWSQDAAGRVVCHPFAPLDHEARDLLEDRAVALTTFLNGVVVPYRASSPFSRSVIGGPSQQEAGSRANALAETDPGEE